MCGQELVPVSAVSLAALVPGTQRSPELGTTGRRLDIDTITLHTLDTAVEKSILFCPLFIPNVE